MANKIGRNDKCPCGSGLKYKRCCMLKHSNEPTFDIQSFKIKAPDGNGFYRVIWDDKVEKVNPVEYYKECEIKRRAIDKMDKLSLMAPDYVTHSDLEPYLKSAREEIESEHYWEKISKENLHPNFLTLLEVTKKKKQVALLKGLTLTPNQLLSLILKSYSEHNYLYSRYTFEHLPKDLSDKQKPVLADLSVSNQPIVVGNTDMTSGEVRKMVDQRKVIIANFFDRVDEWHCFFITYNSIEGKENHKNGQPHFHYISSAFDVTREEFIESLKTGKYKLTSVHIDLLDYGNQPE